MRQYEGNMCVKVLGVQMYKCKRFQREECVIFQCNEYDATWRYTANGHTVVHRTLYTHSFSSDRYITCITCSRTPEGKISWPCAGLKSSPAVAVISNVLYSTDATPVTSRPRRTATTLERGRRMRKERMWVSVHVIVCTTLITPLRAHSRVGILSTFTLFNINLFTFIMGRVRSEA